MSYVHKPVMLEEVINNLLSPQTSFFLDCTLGEGGHSHEILTRFPGIIIYGLDRDNEILKTAGNRLSKFNKRFYGFNVNFKDVNKSLINFDSLFDAALIDLGISMFHYKKSGRGFSFSKKEKLSMKLDNGSIDVYEIINSYSKEEIIKIFFEYGEERFSRRISEEIIKRRAEKPIEYSDELADIIYKAIPAKFRNKKIHPATKCFQALRIYANSEFENIKKGIPNVLSMLKVKGRLGVITFHSLEDRIVKKIFAELYKDCICDPSLPVCTCEKRREISWIAKLIIPSKDEQDFNPASRSAKLRVVEKL